MLEAGRPLLAERGVLGLSGDSVAFQLHVECKVGVQDITCRS